MLGKEEEKRNRKFHSNVILYAEYKYLEWYDDDDEGMSGCQDAWPGCRV